MPYKNNDYRNFIRSARWQRLRAYHLKRHPLCARCKAKGKVTLATEVHHITPCMDNPALQGTRATSRAYARPAMPHCRQHDRRGFCYATDSDGYATDPKHPCNRPRLQPQVRNRRNEAPGGWVNILEASKARPAGH